MEQETKRTESQGAPAEQETVKGGVSFHGTYLGEIALPFGAKLSDAIEKIRDLKPDLSLNGVTIMLNDRMIELTEGGALKEDPVLLEDFTLSLAKKFKGGK